MIDGVIALVTDDDVAPDDVTLIDIRVSAPAARFTDQPRPTTPMQAKFSLRHCAAAAAIFRRVGTEELSQAILTRPDVVDLRDRVKVVTDPALGKQDADVEITLASGRSLAAPGAGKPRHSVSPSRRRRARREIPRAGRPCSRSRAHRATAGHLLAVRRPVRRLGPARADRACRWLTPDQTSPW